MKKSGKEHKTLLIILVLFIAFVFNSTVVFAKPTNKEKAIALEDFRYYYNDYDYSFKNFKKSAEYKIVKENSDNAGKTDEDLYINYYLTQNKQVVENLFAAMADGNFDMTQLKDDEYSAAVDMANAIYDNIGTISKGMGTTGSIDFNTGSKNIQSKVTADKRFNNLSSEQQSRFKQGGENSEKSAEISKGEGKTESVDKNKIEKAREKNRDIIYKQPNVVSSGRGTTTLEDMISDADSFVAISGKNDKIDRESLAELSGVIYNIALQIGIAIAVIMGLTLGIQFMLTGVDGRADVKKALTVYTIGCVVIFGAFGIWKLVVELIQQI